VYGLFTTKTGMLYGCPRQTIAGKRNTVGQNLEADA
jgi:hypothetical protein